MTDHKDEAERRLNLVTGNGVGGMTSGEYIGNRDHEVAIAQVHATLALAEQQRIANLIAIASMESVVESGIYTLCDPPNSEWSRYRLKPEIREGLGLS